MFTSTKLAKLNSYPKGNAIHPPQGFGQNNFLNLMNSQRGITPANMFQTYPQFKPLASDQYKGQNSLDLSSSKIAKKEHPKEILDLIEIIKEEPIKIEEVNISSEIDEEIPRKMNEQKNVTQQTFSPSLTGNNFQIQQILFENILRRAKIEYTKHFIDQMQKNINQFSKEVEVVSQNMFSNLPFPNFNLLSGFGSLLNSSENSLLVNLSSNQSPFQESSHMNLHSPPNFSNGQDQEKLLKDERIAKVKQSKKIKKDDLVDKKKSQSELLKNITKNYGKACSKFASGQDGLLYLKKHAKDEEETKEFQEFIRSNAENIKNIPFFRESILVMPDDSPKIAKFKNIFKSLCEIFLSKYAVKWIFSSKQLLNRRGHLSYRRKILRRIQDPENFVNLNN